MTLLIFLIWGAHAPSREMPVRLGLPAPRRKSLLQVLTTEIYTKSSRSRGRDRSEPDWRLHARRMRSPFRIKTR